jgi:protein KRI1
MSSKKAKQKLFDEVNEDSSDSSSSSDDSSSSSSDSSVEKLTVNKSYAKEYQSRKQKEELKNVQQRDGNLSSDESSSEEEDEDGQLMTPSVDLQFLKTIKALRNKEVSIYDPKTQFFEEGDDHESEKGPKKKEKPKRFKDVLREQILEKMDDEGNAASDGEEESTPQMSKLSYNEQQDELRKAFLKDSTMASDDDSKDGDDWMMVKKKAGSSAKGGNEEVEKQVLHELKAMEKSITDGKKSKDFVDPRGEVEDGERFLLDFIKNKKWIDKSHDDDKDDESEGNGKEDNDSEDASLGEIDKADNFEANYNFRFEQAAAETTSGAAFSVQAYARGQTMNTLRRKDETRRDKRLARNERKTSERKVKEEQLKRLKNAKRQEMNEKLAKVKTVLGEVEGDKVVDEVAIMKMLEGDYDPEKFEQAMQAAYGDDFYEKQDGEWKNDMDVRESLKTDEDGHALVGQDDVDGGLYDNYEEDHEEEEDYDEAQGDDGDGMEEDDADEEFLGGDEEQDTELEKKIKAKMQDELYKLDYEDVIAGMPTRFKYRQVERNSYGLTTEEILFARDTTLKQFVSLKKMAPYSEESEYNVNSKKRRRFREMLKQEMLEEETAANPPREDSAVNEEEGEADNNEPKKKRRRLKKGRKNDKDDSNSNDQKNEIFEIKKENSAESAEAAEAVIVEGDEEGNSKRRRKKKGKKGLTVDSRDEETANSEDNSRMEVITADSTALAKKSQESTTKSSKMRKKKTKVAGVSASRLASYGL